MTDERATDERATDERREALPDHETRPERATGAGIVGEGWTASDPGEGLVGDGWTASDPAEADDRIDPEGMPAAAFDRRTMEAEGGEAERDDDTSDRDEVSFTNR